MSCSSLASQPVTPHLGACSQQALRSATFPCCCYKHALCSAVHTFRSDPATRNPLLCDPLATRAKCAYPFTPGLCMPTPLAGCEAWPPP
eukprot:11035394-Alexandrium_andersonii.AAC.1